MEFVHEFGKIPKDDNRGINMNCKKHIPLNDTERGEVICQACGQVLEERMIDTNDLTPKNSSSVTDSSQHLDLGQSTLISKSMEEIPHENRSMALKIRKWDNRIKYDSNKKEKIRNESINNICDKLQLPEYVKLELIQFLAKAKNERVFAGRITSEIEAGATLYMCKKYDIPKSIKSIANALDTKPAKVYKALKVLSEKYGTQNKIQPIESFIPQIISAANMTESHANEVRRILENVKKLDDNHVGKSPLVVIGAIALTVSRKSGNHYMTQRQMAEIAGISDVAIRLMTVRLGLNVI